MYFSPFTSSIFLFTFCFFFIFTLSEKLYKEPAVRVPSLLRVSEIAKGLGLDLEESELAAYRGENLYSGNIKRY